MKQSEKDYLDLLASHVRQGRRELCGDIRQRLMLHAVEAISRANTDTLLQMLKDQRIALETS